MGSNEQLLSFLPLLVMLVFFYFFIMRPQKKKDKEITEMRNSIKVGDDIVTIGGMVGKVVLVKEDLITFETSGMKTRIEIQKWGISSVVK